LRKTSGSAPAADYKAVDVDGIPSATAQPSYSVFHRRHLLRMPAKPPSGSRAAPGAANKTTPTDASRIQSTQAKAGADTGKGSFPARSQAAASRNTGTGGKAGKAAK